MYLLLTQIGDKRMMTKLYPLASNEDLTHGFSFSFVGDIPAKVRWAVSNVLEREKNHFFAPTKEIKEALIFDFIEEAADIYRKHDLAEKIRNEPLYYDHFESFLKQFLQCNLASRYGLVRIDNRAERMAS